MIFSRLSYKFWATYPLIHSVLGNALSVLLGLGWTLAVSSANRITLEVHLGLSRRPSVLPTWRCSVCAVRVVGLSVKAARVCGDRAPSSLELTTQHNQPDWGRNTQDEDKQSCVEAVCALGKQQLEPQLSASSLFHVRAEYLIFRSYFYFSIFWAWGGGEMLSWVKYERLLFGKQASWWSSALEGLPYKCLSEKRGVNLGKMSLY